MQGRSVLEYEAPLFLAWQLTNRCSARCIACCEESGPDKAWRDELSRDEALDLTDRVIRAGIPYVAFGGGEPLSVPHAFDIFDRLTAAGVAIKLETDASRIDDAAADRIAELAMQCVQISVDGATAATHERVRPGSSFAHATAAIGRLVSRGLAPQFVFVPTRLNVDEIVAAFDLAVSLGCSAFVTGPAMRIGRAALAWDAIGLTDEAWQRAANALRAHAQACGAHIGLAIYQGLQVLGGYPRRAGLVLHHLGECLAGHMHAAVDAKARRFPRGDSPVQPTDVLIAERRHPRGGARRQPLSVVAPDNARTAPRHQIVDQ